jgi:hypothetical protein
MVFPVSLSLLDIRHGRSSRSRSPIIIIIIITTTTIKKNNHSRFRQRLSPRRHNSSVILKPRTGEIWSNDFKCRCRQSGQLPSASFPRPSARMVDYHDPVTIAHEYSTYVPPPRSGNRSLIYRSFKVAVLKYWHFVGGIFM